MKRFTLLLFTLPFRWGKLDVWMPFAFCSKYAIFMISFAFVFPCALMFIPSTVNVLVFKIQYWVIKQTVALSQCPSHDFSYSRLATTPTTDQRADEWTNAVCNNQLMTEIFGISNRLPFSLSVHQASMTEIYCKMKHYCPSLKKWRLFSSILNVNSLVIWLSFDESPRRWMEWKTCET